MLCLVMKLGLTEVGNLAKTACLTMKWQSWDWNSCVLDLDFFFFFLLFLCSGNFVPFDAVEFHPVSSCPFVGRFDHRAFTAVITALLVSAALP